MYKNPQLTLVYDAMNIGLANELIVALDYLPIEKLSREKEKSLFVCLMQQAESSPLGLKAVKLIMERWYKGDIDGNLPETPVYFLMMPDVPQSVINLMVKALDNWDYFNFVYSLIHQDSSPEVQMALNRLEEAYDEQDPEIYRALLEQIDKQRVEEESYNHVVKEFLEHKLDKVSDYVNVPEWIVSFYGEHIPFEGDPELEITKEMSIENILPSAEDAADAVLDRVEGIPTHLLISEEPDIKKVIEDKDLKPEDPIEGESCPLLTTTQLEALKEAKKVLKDAFIMAYNAGTLRQKVALLGDLAGEISEEVLNKDDFIFSILGPANPIYGMPLDPESICCKYGGCRMFTCIDFENEDDYGIIAEDNPEEYIEWFSGACEACHKKIAKKIYSIRRPLTFGGWKGTFCSFKCLRSVVPLNDILNHALIDRIEEQLLDIGIQDRIVAGEGELNNEELKEELEKDVGEEVDGEFPKVIVQTIPESKIRKYM